MYVRLLEDCFDCGIDLTHSYTALVEMCVHQIHQLATACQFNVGEQELETKDVELTDSNEGNECLIRWFLDVLRQLDYYTTVISRYYVLLDQQKNRSTQPYSREDHILHEEEIPRWQKAFEDQFVLSPSTESSSEYSYRDLAQWVQCIQPVIISFGIKLVIPISNSTCFFSVTSIPCYSEHLASGLLIWEWESLVKVFQTIWRSHFFRRFIHSISHSMDHSTSYSEYSFGTSLP